MINISNECKNYSFNQMEPSEKQNHSDDQASNDSGSNEKAWEEYEKMESNQQGSTEDIFCRRTIDISQLEKCLSPNSSHGLTGSHNLGNTCFMNSSIQCLSNSLELTTYFLTKQYEKEINKSNPLGLGGKLAKAWYNLLHEFWVENTRVGDAREFKSTISKRAHQFSGYSQHDSHELITFFLDTLNEDLNKTSEKPYREIDEQGDNEDDATAAARFWKLHLERNDSIITDLFNGMFKTTIQCPNCHWISRTYDPFNILSVPIPMAQGMSVFYVPKMSLGKTIKMTIRLTDYTLCGELQKLISLVPNFNYKPNKLRCFLVTEKKCIRAPKPDEKLVDFINKGYLFCGNADYENDENKKDCCVMPLYLGTEEEEELSAYPRILSVYKNMTYDEIKKVIYGFARKYIKVPIESPEIAQMLEVIKKEQSEYAQTQEDQMMKLLVDEYTKIFMSKEDNKDIKEFLEDLPFEFSIRKDGQFKYIFKNKKLPLSKNCEIITVSDSDEIAEIFDLVKKEGWEFYLQIIKQSAFNNVSDIKKFFNTCTTIGKSGDYPLSLFNCLETFRITEKLEKNNTWYCKKCKTHQEAFKKMELYYLPKLLVIHLKRFTNERRYSGWNSWSKNDATIDFPITDFDISPYVVGPQKKGIKYDLYAVSQHYGGCGGGHYTAICKNGDKWYDYNDSSVSSAGKKDIVSSAAYVLFYRRKD